MKLQYFSVSQNWNLMKNGEGNFNIILFNLSRFLDLIEKVSDIKFKKKLFKNSLAFF